MYIYIMMRIKLTQGKFALIDDEDYSKVVAHKWFLKKHGTVSYAISKTRVRMHRLILGLTNPKIIIDHRDRNGLNNQRRNLRICTQGENVRNTSSRIGSTSRYLGVYFDRGRCNKKWVAAIASNHVRTFIGSFAKEVDAAKAYNKYAISIHGEFANLNVIKKNKP